MLLKIQFVLFQVWHSFLWFHLGTRAMIMWITCNCVWCSFSPGYRDTVLESLQQVFILDGVDRFGNPGEDSPTDIPGLEDFLEHLLCTDTNVDVRTATFWKQLNSVGQRLLNTADFQYLNSKIGLLNFFFLSTRQTGELTGPVVRPRLMTYWPSLATRLGQAEDLELQQLSNLAQPQHTLPPETISTNSALRNWNSRCPISSRRWII